MRQSEIEQLGRPLLGCVRLSNQPACTRLESGGGAASAAELTVRPNQRMPVSHNF
jgi:hypothetical protein